MTIFRKLMTGIAAAATLAAAQPSPAQSETVYASIRRTPDLNRYCQVHYGVNARLKEYSALSWVCYKNKNTTWGISVKQACQEQFRLPLAAYRDRNDPYSWFCTRPKPKPHEPGVDLTRYCKKHFGVPAKLIGKTALDWVCYRNQYTHWGILVSQACKEQHNLPKATYRNVHNAYSWYCHR